MKVEVQNSSTGNWKYKGAILQFQVLQITFDFNGWGCVLWLLLTIFAMATARGFTPDLYSLCLLTITFLSSSEIPAGKNSHHLSLCLTVNIICKSYSSWFLYLFSIYLYTCTISWQKEREREKERQTDRQTDFTGISSNGSLL